MKLPDYKYIFWDLDGTVIDSYRGVITGIRRSLKEVCDMDLTEDPTFCRRFIGPPLTYSFANYLGLDEETSHKVIDVYRDWYFETGVFQFEVFDGVKDAMTKLCEAGYYQSIASSKTEEQCAQIMKHAGLDTYMNEIVGAAADGSRNTKAKVLEEAFRRIKELNPDFDKSQVVLIGDTRFDVNGAKEVGIDCIGISYGFGTVEELVENGVVAVFDRAEDVAEAILK